MLRAGAESRRPAEKELEESSGLRCVLSVHCVCGTGPVRSGLFVIVFYRELAALPGKQHESELPCVKHRC